MAKEKPVETVSTPVDEETGRNLRQIEKVLDIKPAAVARRGLRKIIPELLKQVKLAEPKA